MKKGSTIVGAKGYTVEEALEFIAKKKVAVDPKKKVLTVTEHTKIGLGTLGRIDFLKKQGYRMERPYLTSDELGLWRNGGLGLR